MNLKYNIINKPIFFIIGAGLLLQNVFADVCPQKTGDSFFSAELVTPYENNPYVSCVYSSGNNVTIPYSYNTNLTPAGAGPWITTDSGNEYCGADRESCLWNVSN